MIYDHLVSEKEALELRNMASSLVHEMGETNYYSRESINLHWVNLHHVFKEGYKLNVFKDKDFDLINKASKAAKVSSKILVLSFFIFLNQKTKVESKKLKIYYQLCTV